MQDEGRQKRASYWCHAGTFPFSVIQIHHESFPCAHLQQGSRLPLPTDSISDPTHDLQHLIDFCSPVSPLSLSTTCPSSSSCTHLSVCPQTSAPFASFPSFIVCLHSHAQHTQSYVHSPTGRETFLALCPVVLLLFLFPASQPFMTQFLYFVREEEKKSASDPIVLISLQNEMHCDASPISVCTHTPPPCVGRDSDTFRTSDVGRCEDRSRKFSPSSSVKRSPEHAVIAADALLLLLLA